MRLYMGLISLISGLILTYFSYQDWYIDWVQKRMLVDRNRIITVDRRMGVGLTVVGILQTLSALFNQ